MTKAILALNDDQVLCKINYHENVNQSQKSELEAQWKSFNRYDPALALSYKILMRPTSPSMDVSVDHLLPSNSTAGRYRIETFIPAIHANSRKTIYIITRRAREVNNSIEEDHEMVMVDTVDQNDVWYPLGEFYLDTHVSPAVGRVRQFSVSLEDPPVEMSFGPVRWVPLFDQPGRKNQFDSPVGSKPERNASFPTGRVAFTKYPVWAGQWFDANPFLTWYTYGYHTGADLNLPGSSSADKGKEIYSCGEGVVTYAGKAGTWGNIIVIEHPTALVTLPDGRRQRQRVYSRYGHVDDRIEAKKGREVDRGQLIGYIGLAAGATAGWHLHFDVCYTDLLKTRPSHWPDMDIITRLRTTSVDHNSRSYTSSQMAIKKEVMSNYVDPLRFIADNHN
jgi:murein DD-endopeptidase MepM/ murein hydrolase activator NlpD